MTLPTLCDLIDALRADATRLVETRKRHYRRDETVGGAAAVMDGSGAEVLLSERHGRGIDHEDRGYGRGRMD
jgi:hypothetical protein